MEGQQNKSRIPRKLNSQATALTALVIPPPNVKGTSGQRRQPSTFGKVKAQEIATAASNGCPQTFKTLKVGQGIKAASKVSQEKKQTAMYTVTKTPNVTRLKWTPSSRRNPNGNRTVKGNVGAYRTGTAVKPAIKSIMTAHEKTKRLVTVPTSDLSIANTNDKCQKKLVTSVPSIKRKNKVAPVGRNVRRREVSTDKLNSLRDQNIHLKADLSAAQITKAVTIAGKTSLEIEKERLKKEHNIKFGEVCQLEHVLACEQSKVANLLDQIAKQHSDYLLMAQEKDNLVKNRAELQGKNNEADKELDELAKTLAISDAELKEVAARLDEKLHINADLKSSVGQLRARLGNSQPASTLD